MASRGGNVRVKFIADDSDLKRGSAKAEGTLAHLERAGSKSLHGLATAAKIGSVALGVGLVGALKGSLDAFAESEKVAAQTTAVLKSTGGAANLTAKQISDLATAISKKSGMDDEAIQSGENLLLTFTKLRDEQGKGNDIFTRATGIMADMSTALGQDTKSSAIQLGKALNDPIKGVSALQRVGVSFTAGQKEQIKTLVEHGKTLDAQKLILKELTTEFGGSAKAAGDTFAGKINKAKVQVGNLGEAIGGVLAPALGGAADAVADFIGKLSTSDRPAKFFAGIKGHVDDAKALFSNLFDDIGKRRGQGASLGAAIGGSIADAVSGINWRELGHKISTGLESALDFGDRMTASVSAGIAAAVSKVNGRQVLGKLVDILGEAIDALFSPSFWQEHWKSILATVTLVIPVGKLLKIPGFATLFRFISKPVFSAIEAMGRGALDLFGKAASEAGVEFLAGIEKLAPRTARLLLNVVTRAPGALKGLPGKLSAAAQDAVDSFVKAIGGAVGRVAAAGVKLGVELIKGIIKGLKGLPNAVKAAIVAGVTAAADKAGGLLDKINPFGDGIGKVVSGAQLPQVGPFGGSLMGARSAMRPWAAEGAKFGLHVSSGLRPGAITSSGNRSWHSTGEAIDMAGPPKGMLAYFRELRSRFGSRLAELIHTPGGTGIKNGQPFRYTGRVAADHFDHVHVAFDSGKPGLGDGLGKFMATSYGPPWGGIQGTGVTATGVNLKDNPHLYGVAVDPSVIPLGSNLKITPNPFGYSGTFKAFDTGGAIKGNRIDFYDWRGRKSQLGWGSRSVSVSTTDSASKGASKEPKETAAQRRRRVSRNEARARAREEARDQRLTDTPGTSQNLESEIAAADVGAQSKNANTIRAAEMRRQAAIKARIAKIRRALRGHLSAKARTRLRQELAQLLGEVSDPSQIERGFGDPAPTPVAAGPTPEDFINAQIAQARLTPGTEDDIAALTGLQGLRAGDYAAAVASGDPRRIADTANTLVDVNESLKALKDSIDQATALQAQQDAVNVEIRDNQRRLLALADQDKLIEASVGAMVNGWIGERVGRSFGTVSAPGQVAAYGGRP